MNKIRLPPTIFTMPSFSHLSGLKDMTEGLFIDYLSTIAPYNIKVNLSPRGYASLLPFFEKIISGRWSDLSNGDKYNFFYQFLSGCRFSEISLLRLTYSNDFTCLSWNTLKGGLSRELRLPRHTSFGAMLFSLREHSEIQTGFKYYYRHLIKYAPFLCYYAEQKHLTATHILRHFYIQCLYSCWGIPKKDITHIMGWAQDSTIESYIDSRLFIL